MKARRRLKVGTELRKLELINGFDVNEDLIG